MGKLDGAVRRLDALTVGKMGERLRYEMYMKQLEEGVKMGSFPFRSVGEKFRIIDDDAYTVFIPRTDDAQIIAQRLLRGERSRALMRQAAQESVSVYREHYKALLARGALDVLDEGIAVLTDMALYSEHTGLKLLAGESGLANFV